MLSYQHHYHAGNAADVHKHAVLAWVLAYLTAKPKPLSYIETHAGRGLYDLGMRPRRGPARRRRGSGGWRRGCRRITLIVARLRQTRAAHGPSAYPGSPLIAAQSLRAADSLHLAELHPGEHAALERALAAYPARIRREDGMRWPAPSARRRPAGG